MYFIAEQRQNSRCGARGDAKQAEILICVSDDLRQKVRRDDSGSVCFSRHSRAGDSKEKSDTFKKTLLFPFTETLLFLRNMQRGPSVFYQCHGFVGSHSFSPLKDSGTSEMMQLFIAPDLTLLLRNFNSV